MAHAGFTDLTSAKLRGKNRSTSHAAQGSPYFLLRHQNSCIVRRSHTPRGDTPRTCSRPRYGGSRKSKVPAGTNEAFGALDRKGLRCHQRRQRGEPVRIGCSPLPVSDLRPPPLPSTELTTAGSMECVSAVFRRRAILPRMTGRNAHGCAHHGTRSGCKHRLWTEDATRRRGHHDTCITPRLHVDRRRPAQGHLERYAGARRRCIGCRCDDRSHCEQIFGSHNARLDAVIRSGFDQAPSVITMGPRRLLMEHF